MKSAEFISDDLRPMRGPRRAHSGLWGDCPPAAQEKAIAEAKALQAAEEKQPNIFAQIKTAGSSDPRRQPVEKVQQMLGYFVYMR